MIDKEKFRQTIHNVFDGVISYKEQFQVGQYNVDFYFPAINLAVECAMVPHSYYKQAEKERIRDEYIRETLKCDIIKVTESEKIKAINKVLQLHRQKIKNERERSDGRTKSY